MRSGSGSAHDGAAGPRVAARRKASAGGRIAMLLTAGLALPMDGRPPIRDAAVLIEGARIAAVGARREVLARPDAAGHERRDFGDAVLLPGLVNAHIHLEYTHLGPLPAPRPFLPWIRDLVAWSAERAPADWERSARDGVAQSLRAGVTCLGEIVTRGPGLGAMVEAGLHGVAYVELAGVREENLAEKLARFDALVATAEGQVQAAGDPGLRVGLSPHAPYSIVGRMIGHVAERARDAGMPLAMHLAESPGEVALLRDGTGVIAEFLRAGLAEGRGEPPDYYREGGHGLGPIAYAAARGLFAPGHPTLVIHGVHLDADDIAAIARHGAAVALCPRSNRLLECGDAPVAALLDAGIPLGIGTDSLGSNEDLDLFAELRALAALARGQRPATLPDEGALARRLLGIATAEGARALALDDRLGALAPGKLADLAVLDLDVGDDDPHVAVLDRASAAGVRCTVLGGRVVHEAATVRR
jgi:aminodeoxyfutalosine deaminase